MAEFHPLRPLNILLRLKDVRHHMKRSDGSYGFPEWYVHEAKNDPAASFNALIHDAIEEIEMHQRINGDLYKKLYG